MSLSRMTLGVLAVALVAMAYPCDDDEGPRPSLSTADKPDLEDAADAALATLPDDDIEPPMNPGWIGGPCGSDRDCAYAGGRCLSTDAGFPGGHCTSRCTGLCPDHRGALYSDSLCVADPAVAEEGTCMARCALHLTPSGCRRGYVCTTVGRFRAESAERLVCVPDLGSAAPETACTRALRDLGLAFGRPDLVDAETVLPVRGGSKTPCQMDTAVLLSSPMHSVDYRETGRPMAEHLLVSCNLALALERTSAILMDLGVVEVEHVGTYNCRGVAGSTRLSAHAEGRALDIKGFERTQGLPVSISADWSGPDPERRAFLRNVVNKLKAAGIFQSILTPDFDARHRDHLHLEIKR